VLSAEVGLPLWLVAILIGLAGLAALDRMLMPGVRWFLRRRVNRVIDEINTRLHLEIQPFKLTRRQALIDLLTYDPKVVEAAVAHARETGQPRERAIAEAKAYAREIVPSFNALIYFRLGYWFAKRVARLLYRLRLGYADEAGLRAIHPKSTVVFVINHRSNMDYVLVAFLAAEHTALSYAVGEWARVWPLAGLVRAMGAYFIRRNSKSPLYRRVLERYVHMATANGVCQALFPEGGLSRDGRLRPPKMGLIDYMVRGFDPKGDRDVVFVPVGLNYDRVLEDRNLLRDLDPALPRPSRLAVARSALGFMARNAGRMASGTWYRFGYACVNFGTPLSLRDWLAGRALDFRDLDPDRRQAEVGLLADALMARIGGIVPVLPVPLVATVLLEAEAPLSPLDVKTRVASLMAALASDGARLYIPRGDQDYAIEVGLRHLALRRLAVEAEGLYRASPEGEAVLRYYANSIAHLRPEGPALGAAAVRAAS